MALFYGSSGREVSALLVEDDDLVREVLRAQLEDCGITKLVEASKLNMQALTASDSPRRDPERGGGRSYAQALHSASRWDGLSAKA
jgi:CheY-like chemotaxis protein